MDDNIDANDEFVLLGAQAVRDAFGRREDTMPPIAPYDEEDAEQGDIFPFLSPAEIEALPPPRWLVHETVSEDGITIIYGDPGTCKSFAALDMALRIAQGMDWHGKVTRKTGVLYIAGEGARGLGKRMTGWRMHHRFEKIDGPFVLVPIAVQLLDPAERFKLIRTIDAVKAALSFDVGLIIIDTISRAIAGADENGQETMSAFIQSCDIVRRHAGGAVIGIHHSGKDKERGMRGSTVLLGACDASLRLTKDDGIVTLAIEKQKDAEEGRPIHLAMKSIVWETDDGETISTLVPIYSEAPKTGADTIPMANIRMAFSMLTDAWEAKKPLSHRPQTKADGRYAPSIFATKIGGEAHIWKDAIASWLENGAIAYEEYDKSRKRFGICVLEPIF